MKKILLLLSLFICHNSEILAEMPSKAPESQENLLEAASLISEINSKVQDVGVVKSDCIACTPTTRDAVYVVDKKQIDIGKPYQFKADQPYVLHLKINQDSPEKVVLKLKNGHSVCLKNYVGPASMLPNANWTVECMIKGTEYEDEEIEINLKDYNQKLGAQESLMAIKIFKRDQSRSAYSVNLEVLKGPIVTSKVSKKFWGDGYNIELLEQKP